MRFGSSKVEKLRSGPDGDLSRPGASAASYPTTSYLQVWCIIRHRRGSLATGGSLLKEQQEKNMGPFWKKMLRLSRARSKGLAHGHEFDAPEVRPRVRKVTQPFWNWPILVAFSALIMGPGATFRPCSPGRRLGSGVGLLLEHINDNLSSIKSEKEGCQP